MISNSFDNYEETSASPYDCTLIDIESTPSSSSLFYSSFDIFSNIPARNSISEVNAMRFSTLSDCSTYHGLSGTSSENETLYNFKYIFLLYINVIPNFFKYFFFKFYLKFFNIKIYQKIIF